MVCKENQLDSIFDLKSPSDTDIFFHAIRSYRFLVLNRQSFSTDWTFRILELTELCSFKGVTVDAKMSLRIVGDIIWYIEHFRWWSLQIFSMDGIRVILFQQFIKWGRFRPIHDSLSPLIYCIYLIYLFFCYETSTQESSY